MKNFKDVNSWDEVKKILKEVNELNQEQINFLDEIEPIGVCDFMEREHYGFTDNTYNNPNIINFVAEIGLLNKDLNDNDLIFISFHLTTGDIRVGYSDYFIFKYNDAENILYGFGDEEEWKKDIIL